ncbi:unnamed protein product, partial [Ectocarpus sp. 12 AP-2014]
SRLKAATRTRTLGEDEETTHNDHWIAPSSTALPASCGARDAGAAGAFAGYPVQAHPVQQQQQQILTTQLYVHRDTWSEYVQNCTTAPGTATCSLIASTAGRPGGEKMASAAASQQSQDRTRVDGCEVEIFKLVQREATSKQWKEWLRAPLEHAAASGNLGLFTRLMDAGASAEAGWRGCDGRTLLGAAACSKSKKIVRSLLTAGAKSDVNVLFGAKRESALHLAAARGAEEASKVLMIAGAIRICVVGGIIVRSTSPPHEDTTES